MWVIGLRADHKMMSQQTKVASVDAIVLSVSRTLQFRDTNLETISLVNPPTDFDGVLVNKSGEVVALWSSFAFEAGRELQQENKGIPAELVAEMIPAVTQGQPLYSFEAEFLPIPLAAASKLGLPAASGSSASRSMTRRAARRWPLRASSRVRQQRRRCSPATCSCRSTVKCVNRFREVERAVQKDQVNATIWRNGAGAHCADRHSRARWARSRSGTDLGRRHAAGAAPGHGCATWHRAAGSIRCVLLLRIAGDTIWAVRRSAHRRRRRPADARPGQLRQGRCRARGSRVTATQHDYLEQRCRSDHAQARSPLLAGVRAAAYAHRGGRAPTWSESVAKLPTSDGLRQRAPFSSA